MGPLRFIHRVTVKPLTGSGGMGPVFGTPVPDVPAFVLEESKLVRNAAGAEVVSSTQVYCAFGVIAPPGSKVTVWPGEPFAREAEVITAAHAHWARRSFQLLNLT